MAGPARATESCAHGAGGRRCRDCTRVHAELTARPVGKVKLQTLLENRAKCNLVPGDLVPDETALRYGCSYNEIPWEEIAFRTVSTTLELYFADRVRGEFGVHTRAITAAPAARVMRA